MPQNTRAQIREAAVRVYERAIRVLRHRIDAEIASQQIVFQAHALRCVEGKAAVAVALFALAPREGVLLAVARVQEDREIVPYALVAEREEFGLATAHHHPVTLARLDAQQGIAHGASYQVDVHQQAQ